MPTSSTASRADDFEFVGARTAQAASVASVNAHVLTTIGVSCLLTAMLWCRPGATHSRAPIMHSAMTRVFAKSMVSMCLAMPLQTSALQSDASVAKSQACASGLCPVSHAERSVYTLQSTGSSLPMINTHMAILFAALPDALVERSSLVWDNSGSPVASLRPALQSHCRQKCFGTCLPLMQVYKLKVK